jgi:hypothetical protein
MREIEGIKRKHCADSLRARCGKFWRPSWDTVRLLFHGGKNSKREKSTAAEKLFSVNSGVLLARLKSGTPTLPLSSHLGVKSSPANSLVVCRANDLARFLAGNLLPLEQFAGEELNLAPIVRIVD